MEYFTQFQNFTLKVAVVGDSLKRRVPLNYCDDPLGGGATPLVILCQIIAYFNITVQFVKPLNGRLTQRARYQIKITVVLKPHLKTLSQFSFGVCNATGCDGVLELLRTNQAHVSAEALTPKNTRIPHYSPVFATLGWKSGFVYAQKFGESIKVEGNFKQPFEKEPLICLVAVLITISVIKFITHKLKRIPNITPLNLFETFWCSLSQLFGQKPMHSLTVLFCFTQMSIWYYASCRGQVLKLIKPHKAFTNIQELSSLIRSRRVRLVQERKETALIMFNDSNPEFVNLLQKDEFQPVISPELMKSGGEFVCENVNFVAVMFNYVKRYPSCEITIVLTGVPVPQVSFAFSKGEFPMKKQLMKLMRRWDETMLIEKSIIPKLFKNLENLEKGNEFPTSSFSKTVQLTSLKYAFDFVALSYSLACFLLFIEIFIMNLFYF